MDANVHQAHIVVKPTCAWSGMEAPPIYVHDMHMRTTTKRKQKKRTPPQPIYQVTRMRDWREDRGKTLEEMAEKCGLTYNQLSKMERGLQPYKQAILETYAKVLNCTVVDLLTRAPGEAEDLIGLWARLDERGRKMLLALGREAAE